MRPDSRRAEDGAFQRCVGCKRILLVAELEEALAVCPHCGHHHRIGAEKRIAWTFDPASFEERDAHLRSTDPLEFPEYADKLARAKAKTQREDGIVSGMARLGGKPVSVAVADFDFMGGSMGCVAGEKIARTLERGADERCPVVIVCTSGGARMQEGLFSLMQIAKTTATAQRCRDEGIPYISVLTDPTMAGVLASYASVADVILAEPRSLIGFAGARVSKQAQVSRVPDDFQTAEFVHRSGMIDLVVPRREIRPTLIRLVATLGGHL